MLRRGLMASGAGGGGGPVTYATWNPADKDPSITLSGGDLIAEGSVLGAKMARATIAISGKRYFECSFAPNADSMGAGIAAAGVPLSGYLGQTAGGYGHYLPGNDIYSATTLVYNGSTNSTTPVVVGFALDGTSLWVRVQGGSGWEGGGDPAAGTSPTLTVAAGTYFPACTPYSGASAVTLNAGQSPFVLWTPSGGFAGVS